MKPGLFDRILNRAFGLLVRMGLGLSHNFLLEVRGRKTGRIYSTPVNLLEHQDKRYLVAPRGYTQWVRNVVASGEATLVKGPRRQHVRLVPVVDGRAEILKAYLDRFRPTVQRYFPVPASSAVRAFEPLVDQYPVFEVTFGE